MKSILLAMLMIPSAAFSQQWFDRAGDVALDDAELRTLTRDAALVFYDEGTSRFSAGGAYSYSYGNGGGTAFGTFRLEPDAVICIDYRNGFSRCDRYVRNSGRLVVQTEKGERFPVRP